MLDGEDVRQSVLEVTWTDGAVVAVENTAPANSKSLVSNPVVGTAVMGDTTQELVPNQEKDQRKMMQAQAKQMIVNQVNQGVANQVKQANEALGNKEVMVVVEAVVKA